MSAADRLYTPDLLALTVELADYGPLESAPLHGHARSPTCGSTLDVDVAPGEGGAIGRIGLRVRACAVGQAAAAIFARHAAGRDLAGIALALDRIEAWLAGQGEMPDWPDLALIARAADYPARHGAMLLPWRAAVAALSSDEAAR